MFYRGLTDIVTPDVAPSGTAAQTTRVRLKQENGVRVETLNLKLRLTTAASAITGAAWGGILGVVKEVRVIANDALGKRNVVRMSGIALAMFAQQNFRELPALDCRGNHDSGSAPASLHRRAVRQPAFAAVVFALRGR
jgi:hypothetical protein